MNKQLYALFYCTVLSTEFVLPHSKCLLHAFTVKQFYFYFMLRNSCLCHKRLIFNCILSKSRPLA